jgi:hypothetical protein
MPNPIPVEWVKQIEDFYCGPAVGVMILNGLRVATPLTIKSQRTWQEKIWEVVTQVTTGPARPEEARSSDGYLPEFERQQCFFCAEEWKCWAATPQALRDAVNEYLPPSKELSIVRSINEVTVAKAVLKSIDLDSPAAVAAGAASHWVVVRGYLAGEPDLDSEPVGGLDLNGVYVFDPYVDPSNTDALDFISADEFLHQFLLFVKCASASDRAKKVAIVKKPKPKK